MRSFTSLGAFTLLALFPSVTSRPVPSKRADFVPQLYSEFQISSGTAGDGEAKANAICVDPFAGVDLKTVSAETLAALVTMRGAAEGAESDFNTEISAATGDALAALKNGKTLNKVLKNTCQAEIFRIQLAQGKDVASQLAKKEATVKKNVAADKANAGKATTGIPDSAGAKEREAKGGNIKAAAASVETEAAAPATEDVASPAPATEVATGSAGSFIAQKYADFQISSGTSGTAGAKAAAIFVDPFNGVDLVTVSKETIKAMSIMREAAEAAESDFNEALKSATGEAKDALTRGKIANKVLKLQGFVQILKIQQAQGQDKTTKLAEETTKLTKNTATDAASVGLPSTGIADSPSAKAKESA